MTKYLHHYSFWLMTLILLTGVILRLFKITEIPPALHGDELGIGYNAYSLLRTGKDEYGISYPITFRNDFSPFYTYLTIPFVVFYGLKEISIRLPSAIFGIAAIVFVYLLVKLLFHQEKLALLTAFLISISSWHVATSRLGVEMTLALTFQLAGLVFFLRALNKKSGSFLLAFIFFGLSVLSYQTAKMTTPFLILTLFYLYRFKLQNKWKTLSIYFFALVIFPMLPYFFARPFKEMRFIGISVFTVWKNSFVPNTNLMAPEPIFKLGLMIVINYLKHFDPVLWFIDSDRLRYIPLAGIGLFYFWQLPFILLGYVKLWHIPGPAKKLITAWIVISPLAAALTTGVPYANVGRNLLLLPAIELLSALGLISFFLFLINTHRRSIFTLVLITLAIIVGGYMHFFLQQEFIAMPVNHEYFWGEPFKKAIATVLPYESSVNSIVMTNKDQQAYMYVLFYGKKQPEWLFSSQRTRGPVVGFIQMANYQFRSIDWEKDQYLPNTIFIGTPIEIPKTAAVISEIYAKKDNSVLLRIAHTR